MPAPADLLRSSLAIHVDALVNFLEAMRTTVPSARLFYASTSHVFAAVNTLRQDENTPLAPFGAYGLSKAAGMHCCRWYRDAFGVFVAAGILYNHESPLRRPNFVSQKIVRGAVAAKRGNRDKLILGDLSVRIDWGWAADFVDAMARILSLGRAEDFIIATGEAHSVQEFAAAAYGAVGLDWRDCVEERRAILTKSSPGGMLVGDTTKLRTATGWRPTVAFDQMVHELVRAALEQKGDQPEQPHGADHPKQ
jgi:GDPmannose 4,6-dehydratase